MSFLYVNFGGDVAFFQQLWLDEQPLIGMYRVKNIVNWLSYLKIFTIFANCNAEIAKNQMKKTSRIRHSGKVISNENGVLRVMITQSSACASCKIASHCSASESKEKIVDAIASPQSEYGVGDMVVVTMDSRMGMKAVAIAFAFPLMVMLVVLLVTLSLSSDELWACIASVLSLIPSYVVIYLLRRRTDFRFYVE